jgi:hypothetical protein
MIVLKSRNNVEMNYVERLRFKNRQSAAKEGVYIIMKKLTLNDFQEKLNIFYPNEKLIALSYNGGKKDCVVQCGFCENTYIKKGENFLDKRRISICKNCFLTQPNELNINWMPPIDYEILEKYSGMHNKIAVRHKKCGFIWKITPNNLKLGKGCPKCNKKISKGEQKIIKFLQDNNIEFIHQYPLKIENHNLFIDFYLPQYKLYIEYNGEQHYKPVNFFGGEEKFNEQILHDNLKRQFLKKSLLEISYKDFDRIEEILQSSTTILNRSTL